MRTRSISILARAIVLGTSLAMSAACGSSPPAMPGDAGPTRDAASPAEADSGSVSGIDASIESADASTADAGPTPADARAPTADGSRLLDVSGDWAGRWDVGEGVGDVMTAMLVQEDTGVRGTVSLTASPCFTTGEIEAINDRGDVYGTISSAGASIAISAVATEGRLVGTLYPTGTCAGMEISFLLEEVR
jgi:hypothetical protein